MGRMVLLEYGHSTRGRWFLAWAGWLCVCKSLTSGAWVASKGSMDVLPTGE